MICAGRNLRFALLTVLAEQGLGSITELGRRRERSGLVVGGANPAKTIGDVLRYGCMKGCVTREGRCQGSGRYRAGFRPETTRRHRDRLRDLGREGDRRRAAAATRPGGVMAHAADSS